MLLTVVPPEVRRGVHFQKSGDGLDSDTLAPDDIESD
jgi:hypothetical protein